MVSMKFMVASVVALASVIGVVAMTEPTYAKESDKKCSVETVGSTNTSNKQNSKFTTKNGKVTTKFRVVGENCSRNVTLMVYKLPSGKVKPLEDQKRHAYVWGNFGPGQHKLTVDLPNCAYQADLVTGKKLTGNNGGMYYGDRMLGWTVHKGKKCKQAPKVVTKVVKEKEIVEKPVYVEKEVIVEKEVPVEKEVIVREEVPAELPKTGVASAISGVIGLPALVGSAAYYVRSRNSGE